MHSRDTCEARAERTRRWFVVLLGALLVFAATLQGAHAHPDGLMHADCAVCHTAPHLPRIAAEPAIGRPPAAPSRVIAPAEPLRRHNRLAFDHWNKPPPNRAAAAKLL
jgi:hypothetical protein